MFFTADAVCPYETFKETMVFTPITEHEAHNLYVRMSAWADPTDQLTIEDRVAAWQFCVGKRQYQTNHC